MTIMQGARPITAPGWTGKLKTDLALIDCDVHHNIKQTEDLYPYLPRVYREQVIEQGLRMPGSGYFNVATNAARTDLAESCDAGMKWNGGQRGDDYDLMREHLLDLWNVDRALLTGSTMYPASVLPDPDFAAALCRAFNDWTIEHWLSRDQRFIYAMGISTTDPKLAVEEIDRIGDHPQVKAIILPTGNRSPYGNRHYHPIWEACERHGLTIALHPGNEGGGMAGAPTGVGYPTYYIETRMARPQMAMAHAVSFIAEGVFEKYPRLKVLFDEVDQFWAVGLMWHMDADWKSLRDQTPWIKRLPSEIFRQHIRVGSQPMLEPENPEQFFTMLDAMHAEETLVFSSDWPHWDWDDPATTFPKLPERLHQRVFCENAREMFGL
ncbi:MAG: amidohydrolase family protein [Thermomicrobiales bacterium]